MNTSRWSEIARQIENQPESDSITKRICNLGLELMGVDYVSIGIVVNNSYSTVDTSHDLAVFLDEQQFTFGDGPTYLAKKAIAPILVENIRASDFQKTYPAFATTSKLTELGAIFAFPLSIGGAFIGVMTGYRKTPGPLDGDNFANALVLSSIATAELIKSGAGVSTDENQNVFSLEKFDNSSLQIAAGMVAEQLNCSVIEALVRIRALAFSEDSSVNAIAKKIVTKEISIELEMKGD